jgi:hypothetical protein
MGKFKPDKIPKTPGHVYPEGWKPSDWLIPFEGNNAIIHHGHSDPDDHSLCGPTLFCCAKSASRYIDAFPESAEARANWEMTEAAHVAAWLDAGVKVLYFVFCDPDSSEGLLAGGFTNDKARRVLFKVTPIEEFAPRANRLI